MNELSSIRYWKALLVSLVFCSPHHTSGQNLYYPPSFDQDTMALKLLQAQRQHHWDQLTALIGQLKETVEEETLRFNLRYALKSLYFGQKSVFRRYYDDTYWAEQELTAWVAYDTLMDLEEACLEINLAIAQAEESIAEHQIYDIQFDYQGPPAFVDAAELTVYDIQDGDRVGEIGAGSENLAYILAQTREELEVYINEIDPALLYLNFKRLKKFEAFRKHGHRFFVVEGTPTHTGMEGLALNKVIARRVFHHFSHPDAMLRAIRESLATEGKLYLLERYRDRAPGFCTEQLDRSAILNYLQRAGFHLLEEVYLDNGADVILVFSTSKLHYD